MLSKSKLSYAIVSLHHINAPMPQNDMCVTVPFCITVIMKKKKILAACSCWSSKNKTKDTVGRQLHGGSECVLTAASHRLSGGLQVEDSGRGDRRTSLRHMYTHSNNTDTQVQSVYSATMDNSTVMSSGFPPASQEDQERMCKSGKTKRNVWINPLQTPETELMKTWMDKYSIK